MFNILPPISQEDAIVISLFEKYKVDIFALHTAQFNDEDISGYSDKIYKASMYYMAIQFGLLIYSEYKIGYNTDWSTYLTKYKIDANRKKLACCGIDLDEILTAFGLPPSTTGDCTNGINTLEIEECFEIEPVALHVTVSPTVVNISYLLSTPNECFNYIN